MTRPGDYYTDESGNGRYRSLAALSRDVSRFHELADSYTDQAVPRIPDDRRGTSW